MHTTTSISLRIAAAAGAAMALQVPAAHAQDNALRLGLYDVFYHVKASDVSGPFVPAGVNLDVKNLTTTYFAYTRDFGTALQLEIAAGWPPKAETVGKGPATLGSVPYDGQVVATSKWFSPTVLLNYRFLDAASAVRPYVGIGVNYTHFFARNATAAGQAAFGGPTSISLSDSIGPAATLGLTWRVQGPWTINASYSMSKVKSNLSADTAGIVRTTSINFNPSVLVVSGGYSF
ncbi:MAG TPA: OmpW family outer membrane protein [Burkholderiaceae bacterium]|nr:OmpW family outer membrane protein [Burkholderiaceae bacterium]